MHWPRGCRSAEFSPPPGVGTTLLAASPPFLQNQCGATWTGQHTIKRDRGSMGDFPLNEDPDV